MSFSLLADISVEKITDIPPSFFNEKGIKFLMIDLDNTLAAYDEHSPADDVKKWIADIKEIGITPAIVSNSSRLMRVCAFAENFDVNSVARAAKPGIFNILHLIETSGFTAAESALIGDQIFTDVLAANRAGIMSVMTKPRKFTNIFLYLRYLAEKPFRYFAKQK